MDQETPAVLEAPVTGLEDPSNDEVQSLGSDAGISPADAAEHAKGVDRAFRAINAQPKVKIRVPKVMGPQVVIINGARFNVPANVYVEVPEQVAQILRTSGRI